LKELIESAVFIAALVMAGNVSIHKVHDVVRVAALKKVRQGLPSLVGLTKSLRSERKRR
jgi:hypothetical protein